MKLAISSLIVTEMRRARNSDYEFRSLYYCLHFSLKDSPSGHRIFQCPHYLSDIRNIFFITSSYYVELASVNLSQFQLETNF